MRQETFYLQNVFFFFFQKRTIYKSFCIFKNPNYILINRVYNKMELYIQHFFPNIHYLHNLGP